jgi:hypothetical protein
LKAELYKKSLFPGKPIPIRFKIFALSDSGYIYNCKGCSILLPSGCQTARPKGQNSARQRTTEHNQLIYLAPNNNWEYTRPGLAERILTEKKCISVSILNSTDIIFLNPTQFVIIRLIKYLSIYINNGLSFYLFLNNLFIY